jgi:hypothetical protein
LWVEPEHDKSSARVWPLPGAGECHAARIVRKARQAPELRIGIRRGQRRVDVVEMLAISRVPWVDPLDLFAEVAKAAGASKPWRCRLPEDKT